MERRPRHRDSPPRAGMGLETAPTFRSVRCHLLRGLNASKGMPGYRSSVQGFQLVVARQMRAMLRITAPRDSPVKVASIL